MRRTSLSAVDCEMDSGWTGSSKLNVLEEIVEQVGRCVVALWRAFPHRPAISPPQQLRWTLRDPGGALVLLGKVGWCWSLAHLGPTALTISALVEFESPGNWLHSRMVLRVLLLGTLLTSGRDKKGLRDHPQMAHPIMRPKLTQAKPMCDLD